MRTLYGNKDGKFFEYLHHFSDNDGNRVEPISPGSFAGNAGRGAKFSHLQIPGRRQDGSKCNGILLAGVDHMMEMSKMGMEQCLDKIAAIFAKP
jgi:hypothetical protein